VPPPALPTALIPSLVDRLTDPDAGGPGLRYGYSVDQVLASVRADLEVLLNTRSPYPDVPAEYPLTARSVLAYGLPDLTTAPAASEADRTAIGAALADAVARYEPRLRRVRVAVLDDDRPGGLRQVKFQIDAVLAVDPAPEVGFVTVLELSTGQASVAPTTG
jgi:type VI secretion system protein ImpF